MPRRNLTVALLVAVLFSLLTVSPVAAVSLTNTEACLMNSIMAERDARGLSRLRFDESLVDTARQHSAAMARRGELTHTSPTGMNGVLPAGWTSWGENVGVGGSCQQLHSALMKSASHRTIILDGKMNNLAIGVKEDSRGFFWVTEVFYSHNSTPAGLGPFWDDDTSIHEPDIIALQRAGITDGCGEGRFCPDRPLTRGEMAAFLVRALDLRSVSKDYFSDDSGNIFESSINALAAAGLTSGCGSNSYCPQDLVSRGQMAAFLARALDLPPTAADFFIDDEKSIFEADINRLATAGITDGCTDQSFCPDAPLTRAQMASFLVRSLGL